MNTQNNPFYAKEAKRIAELRRKDKARTATTLSDMTRDELIAERDRLNDKGLRSGYEDQRIKDIEVELARQYRRYEQWA